MVYGDEKNVSFETCTFVVILLKTSGLQTKSFLQMLGIAIYDLSMKQSIQGIESTKVLFPLYLLICSTYTSCLCVRLIFYYYIFFNLYYHCWHGKSANTIKIERACWTCLQDLPDGLLFTWLSWCWISVALSSWYWTSDKIQIRIILFF